MIMIVLLCVCVGFISAFFGIGGGIILVPLLPLIFDLSAHQTVILALLMILFSTLFNTLYFSLSGRVEWPLVLKWTPSVLAGGFIGGLLGTQVSGQTLRFSVFIFLVGVSLKFFMSCIKWSENPNQKKTLAQNQKDHTFSIQKNPLEFFLLSVYGVFAGGLSGFSGVGTGVALNFTLLQFNLVDIKKHSPCVNALMIFVALGGIISFVYKSPPLFLELYQIVGSLNLFLGSLGIIGGTTLGRMVHNLDLHKHRLFFLFILTSSLAFKVLFEIIH